MTDNSPDFVYRFRPLNRLLGAELASQQIYFAPPSELNDPMEGFYDVFWKGDQIVWKNLFKHYIACLCHIYLGLRVGVTTLSRADIPILLTSDRFPSSKYAELMSSVWDRFFSLPGISSLIGTLGSSNREVRREELFFYLRTVHGHAFSIIAASDGQSPAPPLDPNNILLGLEAITSALGKGAAVGLGANADESEVTISSHMFDVLNSISAQRDLVRLCESPTLFAEDAKRFILLDFTGHYLDRLEVLCFPPWYTACFVAEIRSPALWAHYGANHTGACLKFRTAKIGAGGVGLRLEHIKGYSGGRCEPPKKIRGFDVLPLQRIIYDQRYPSLDFFQSLGRLPLPALFRDWYGSETGQHSAAAEVLADEAGWRERYWETFRKSKIIKLPDWAYEKEYRIVLSSSIDDLDDKNDRLLRFDFRDLDEIVFGVRTSTQDKIEVLKLAESECRAFNHFDLRFSQMAYSHATGQLEVHPLPLIKLAPA